jgi:hypothetical protein
MIPPSESFDAWGSTSTDDPVLYRHCTLYFTLLRIISGACVGVSTRGTVPVSSTAEYGVSIRDSRTSTIDVRETRLS